MSSSPSLLSLRRKRSTRSGESSGSPAIKKSSPKLPEAKKEPPSTPKAHSSHRSKKLTRSSSRTSPRLAKEKSTRKNDTEEKTLRTPMSGKWTPESEESLRQASPDMPFLSSQLCGTQECEVVWDCDSPGFSKDDLKRMHGDKEKEGPERDMVVIQAPHRKLFPLNHSRVSKAPSSGNTTAEINNLLDFLVGKEKEKRKKREREADLLKTLQVVPPKETQSEGNSSGESLVLPRPLREASSQPFEVSSVRGAKGNNQTSNLSDIDDSVWGEDLNIGLSDINDSMLGENEGTATDTTMKSANISVNESDRSRVTSDNPEVSISSTDIFDDDLFSESVILSTQAVEEAMAKNNSVDVTNKKNNLSSYSDLREDLRNVVIEDQENSRISIKNNSNLVTNSNIPSKTNVSQGNGNLDTQPQRQVRRSFRFGFSPKDTAKSGPSITTGVNINSGISTVKNDTRTNKSEPATHAKPTTSNLNTYSSVHSKINVNQKNNNSDNQPQRQVRRSFRFGDTTDPPNSGPSTGSGMTRHTHNSIPETQRQPTTVPRKTNLIHMFPNKNQSLQNPNVSNLVHNKLTKPSTSYNPRSAQVSPIPADRKPLYRSTANTKSEETVSRGNVQGVRGPLLRSQSSGNARIATSSPVTRRSNSSMELDTSQNLEDDEFFRSFLSMLPEDEGGVCDNPGALRLSPIPDERKTNTSGRPFDARPKSNLDARKTSNIPYQNVRNGSARGSLPSQVNPRPGVTNPTLNQAGKRPILNVQGVKPNVTTHSTATTQPLDTRERGGGGSVEEQNSDTFDDGLFQDDVLTLIDEVESLYGSQNAPCESSPSPQSSQPQQVKCTQDEIAAKKAAALRRREEKRRQQCK